MPPWAFAHDGSLFEWLAQEEGRDEVQGVVTSSSARRSATCYTRAQTFGAELSAVAGVDGELRKKQTIPVAILIVNSQSGISKPFQRLALTVV